MSDFSDRFNEKTALENIQHVLTRIRMTEQGQNMMAIKWGASHKRRMVIKVHSGHMC